MLVCVAFYDTTSGMYRPTLVIRTCFELDFVPPALPAEPLPTLGVIVPARSLRP